MGIILDAIFILVLVLSIFITAKKGFLNSIIGVGSFVLSLIIAISISAPISDYIYKNYVRDAVYETTSKAIETTVNDTETSAAQKLDAFYDSLPDFVENFVRTEDISSEEMVNNFSGEILDTDAITTSLFDNIVDPALTTLLNYILVIILATILSVIAKLISKFITGLIKGKVLGKANEFLGGVLGTLSGAFIIIVLYLILTLIANNFNIEPLTEAISASYVCETLSSILN